MDDKDFLLIKTLYEEHEHYPYGKKNLLYFPSPPSVTG